MPASQMITTLTAEALAGRDFRVQAIVFWDLLAGLGNNDAVGWLGIYLII